MHSIAKGKKNAMPNLTPVFSQVTPTIPAGKDIKAALDFYEQKLGFTATYKADDFSMVILKRGAVEIILANSDDPHTASETSLRIQLSGVDALYRSRALARESYAASAAVDEAPYGFSRRLSVSAGCI